MISKELTRCVAKICGDGNLYYRYVRYNNTCSVLLDEFESDVLKEFGDITITKGKGNSGTRFVQVNRKFVIKRFLKELESYNSNKIRIPDSVLKSPKDIKKEFLRAIFDDEGSPSLRLFKKTNEWKRSITIYSNSLKILEQIKIILENEFNIKTNKILSNNKYRDRDKTYSLTITGRQNITNYKDKIGFKHPDKIRRINLMIESYQAQFSRNKEKFYKIKRELDPIKL